MDIESCQLQNNDQCQVLKSVKKRWLEYERNLPNGKLPSTTVKIFTDLLPHVDACTVNWHQLRLIEMMHCLPR